MELFHSLETLNLFDPRRTQSAIRALLTDNDTGNGWLNFPAKLDSSALSFKSAFTVCIGGICSVAVSDTAQSPPFSGLDQPSPM